MVQRPRNYLFFLLIIYCLIVGACSAPMVPTAQLANDTHSSSIDHYLAGRMDELLVLSTKIADNYEELAKVKLDDDVNRVFERLDIMEDDLQKRSEIMSEERVRDAIQDDIFQRLEVNNEQLHRLVSEIRTNFTERLQEQKEKPWLYEKINFSSPVRITSDINTQFNLGIDNNDNIFWIQDEYDQLGEKSLSIYVYDINAAVTKKLQSDSQNNFNLVSNSTRTLLLVYDYEKGLLKPSNVLKTTIYEYESGDRKLVQRLTIPNSIHCVGLYDGKLVCARKKTHEVDYSGLTTTAQWKPSNELLTNVETTEIIYFDILNNYELVPIYEGKDSSDIEDFFTRYIGLENENIIILCTYGCASGCSPFKPATGLGPDPRDFDSNYPRRPEDWEKYLFPDRYVNWMKSFCGTYNLESNKLIREIPPEDAWKEEINLTSEGREYFKIRLVPADKHFTDRVTGEWVSVGDVSNDYRGLISGEMDGGLMSNQLFNGEYFVFTSLMNQGDFSYPPTENKNDIYFVAFGPQGDTGDD